MKNRATIVVGVIVAAAFVGGLAVAVASGDGQRSGALELGTGSAWFGSTTGTVALIDGSTGARVTRLRAAAENQPFSVVQSGSAALVLDKAAGSLVRVDGASWAVSKPVDVGSKDDERLSAYANEDDAWVVSQDGTLIQQIDAHTLSPVGSPQTTPGALSGAVPTRDSTLWVTDAAGDVRSYKAGKQLTTSKVAGVSAATMVLAGDTPVIVDAAKRFARVIDPGSGRAARKLCLDVPAQPAPLLGGASGSRPWLLAVAPKAGTLVVSHTDTGRCQPVRLGDSGDGVRYGTPVERNGLVFVPDFTDGTVIAIDPSLPPAKQIKARIDIGLPDTPVSLLVHNEHVWFDDPAGDRAGVITDELTAISVSKTEGPDEGAVPESDDAPPPPDKQASVSCSHAPTVAAVGQEVIFDARSDDPSREPDTWAWDVPDGDPASGKGPQLKATFDTEGLHNATVEATFGRESETATCPIQVGGEKPPDTPTDPGTTTSPDTPTATTTTVKPGGGGGGGAAITPAFTFAPTAPKVGQAVTFTDATKGTHTIAGWTFQSGTPATSTSASPSVTWASAGTFTVTLTVTTASGAKPVQQQITIAPQGQVVVPATAGMSEASARATIIAAKLKVGAVKQANSIKPAGTTVLTDPAAGSTVAENSTVDIFASTGNGVVRTLATLGVPSSRDPFGLGVDAFGNVYATMDYALKRVSPLGAVGDLVTTDNPDGGVAIGPDGAVYFTSFLDNVVYKSAGGAPPVIIAGTLGSPGFSGDGGAATSAQLQFPIDVSVAANGDVLIADYGNNRIRKVTAANGQISTVVGGGACCGFFTPASATSLYIPQPSAVAALPNGDFVLVNSSSDRVMIVEGGTLSVLAGNNVAGFAGDGGPAAASQVSDVHDVAIDPQGNVLIVDTANHRVRRVDMSTPSRNISTIAGNGNTDPLVENARAVDTSITPFYLGVGPDGTIAVLFQGMNQIFVIT